MNEKTAKMIRSGMLRVHNLNPWQRTYKRLPQVVVAAFHWFTWYPSTLVFRGAFNWFQIGQTLRLAPGSPRALYKKAKRILERTTRAEAQRRNNHG